LQGFPQRTLEAWTSCYHPHAARNIASKLKACRASLNNWATNISSIKVLVQHYNLVIFYLDKLEEFRSLYLPERNFRLIIKKKLHHLLQCQHEYWKQRYTEKLVKWGDENTSFFHARATKRFHYKKYIAF
jgi:hypothetical protein